VRAPPPLVSPIDVIFAVLLVYAAVRCYARGLLGTIASFVAPVLAFMVAADWSDPVRDRLGDFLPAPDFVLDLAAPAVVFIVVVVGVRTAAALVSRVLGLGRSMPSRVLASATGTVMVAFILGAGVLVVRELAPEETERPASEPSELASRPLENVLVALDRRLTESHLGPALADLATMALREAIELGVEGTGGEGASRSGHSADFPA